jgi:hypothetical protein
MLHSPKLSPLFKSAQSGKVDLKGEQEDWRFIYNSLKLRNRQAKGDEKYAQIQR